MADPEGIYNWRRLDGGNTESMEQHPQTPMENVMTSQRSSFGLCRRELMCAGGAATFGSIMASLLGGTRPARAEVAMGAIQEVDQRQCPVVRLCYGNGPFLVRA